MRFMFVSAFCLFLLFEGERERNPYPHRGFTPLKLTITGAGILDAVQVSQVGSRGPGTRSSPALPEWALAGSCIESEAKTEPSHPNLRCRQIKWGPTLLTDGPEHCLFKTAFGFCL